MKRVTSTTVAIAGFPSYNRVYDEFFEDELDAKNDFKRIINNYMKSSSTTMFLNKDSAMFKEDNLLHIIMISNVRINKTEENE